MKFLNLSVISMAVCLSMTTAYAQTMAPDGQVISRPPRRDAAPRAGVVADAPVIGNSEDAPSVESQQSFDEFAAELEKQQKIEKTKSGLGLPSINTSLKDPSNGAGKNVFNLEAGALLNTLGKADVNGDMFLGFAHKSGARHVRFGAFVLPDGPDTTFGGLLQVRNLNFLCTQTVDKRSGKKDCDFSGAQLGRPGVYKLEDGRYLIVKYVMKLGVDGEAQGSLLNEWGSKKANFSAGVYVSPEVQFRTSDMLAGVGLKLSPIVGEASSTRLKIADVDPSMMVGNASAALALQGYFKNEIFTAQLEGGLSKSYFANKDIAPDLSSEGIVVNGGYLVGEIWAKVAGPFSVGGGFKLDGTFANFVNPAVDQDTKNKVVSLTGMTGMVGAAIQIGDGDAAKSQRAIDANRARERQDPESQDAERTY